MTLINDLLDHLIYLCPGNAEFLDSARVLFGDSVVYLAIGIGIITSDDFAIRLNVQ